MEQMLVSAEAGSASAPCVSDTVADSQNSRKVQECRKMVSSSSEGSREETMRTELRTKTRRVFRLDHRRQHHHFHKPEQCASIMPGATPGGAANKGVQASRYKRCHHRGQAAARVSCLRLLLVMSCICYYMAAVLTRLSFAQLISASTSASSLSNLINGGDDEELSKTMEGASEGELSLGAVSKHSTIADELQQPTIWLSDEPHADEPQGIAGANSENELIRGQQSQVKNHDSGGANEEFGGEGEFSRNYISVLNNQSNIVLSPVDGGNYSTSFILAGNGQSGSSTNNSSNTNGPQVISSRKFSNTEEPGTRLSAESVAAVQLTNRTSPATSNSSTPEGSISRLLSPPGDPDLHLRRQQQQRKRKKKKYRLNRVEVYPKRLAPGRSLAEQRLPVPPKERMISYSMVSTTTGRPARKSSAGEDQMILAATSSPVRSLALMQPALVASNHQQILQQRRKLDSSFSTNTNSLALPASGNQFKLAPESLLPAAGSSSYLADQLASIVSAHSDSNNKEFDGSLLPASIGLPHLFSSTDGPSNGGAALAVSPSSQSASFSGLGAYIRLPNNSHSGDEDAIRLSTSTSSYLIPLKQRELSHAGRDKQQPAKAGEYLLTSSSHPTSEFETTLKQRPDHQQEPIVNQDLGAETQGDHPLASSSLKDDDLGGEDDSDPSDGDGSLLDGTSDGSDFPLKTTADQAQYKAKGGASKPTRLDQHSHSTKVDASKEQPAISDTELLVGPFKSEAEAPATITLSGVVYQKSGASSSLVHSKPVGKAAPEQPDNLSTSGSTKVAAAEQQVKPGKQLAEEPAVDKHWPYSSIYNAQASSSPQLGSINEILLGSSMKANQAAEATDSALQFTDSYLGMSGGIRLSPFPFSPSSLFPSQSELAAHLASKGHGNLNGNSNGNKDVPSAHSMISSVLDFANLSPVGSASSDSSSLWTGKKEPAFFAQAAASDAIRAQTTAASDSHHYQSKGHKDKGPIVIVQKDVKPVKYHLMRAYLKLRRLLRPFEATYVFLNDRHGLGGGVRLG